MDRLDQEVFQEQFYFDCETFYDSPENNQVYPEPIKRNNIGHFSFKVSNLA